MANQVLTIASQTNSDSVVNFALIAASTDAGTPTAQSFNLGFVPRWVRVIDVTGLIIEEWFMGMAANDSLHNAAGVITLGTTGAITISTTDPTKGMVTLSAALMLASSSFLLMAMA
jgi:hypothetical protein